MEKIVIIGGGFAGLNLMKRLYTDRFDIHVIDRNNYHCFPPLFYQVAASVLEPSDIAFPLRRELSRRSVHGTYHLGHVKNIDIAARTVTTSYETITYDRLVIAAGCTNNFFGIEGMNRKVFCIKTVAESIHTRDEILDRLERGAICPDPERRRQMLSFLVVGGGPTGVEIAGALGEMRRDILPREYPQIDPAEVSITLVEGTDSLIAAMGPKASGKALKYLRQFGVEVRLGTLVKRYDDKIVTYSDGTSEYRETLIWTAGVTGEPMPGLPAEYVGRGGRILTDEYNRVGGLDTLFAIGDIALMSTPDYPHGHPQIAQPAIQQGRNLARNLNEGRWTHPFRYRDKGSMATVGKHRAVACIGKRTFGGLMAWLAWMFIHLIALVGMRNRLSVMAAWIWNYATGSTQLRLLFRPARYPERRHWGD